MSTGVRGDDSFDALVRDLCALFARGVARRIDDEVGVQVDVLSRRVFRWQFEHNDAYRGYCVGRGATPESVARWDQIPPVPTSAFKQLRLASLEPGRVPEATFRTSGTTRGGEARGEHVVGSLALYRAALLPPFRAHVLPEGGRWPVLALLPSPAAAPDSSLSHMVSAVMDELGAEGCEWLAGSASVEGAAAPDPTRWALDQARLVRALRAAEDEGRPVLIVTTAFALVHALDLLGGLRLRFRLPEGSRLMETGGFKGRSRTVDRGTLYSEVETALGIPARRIVNEYGMTELLSQLYEPVLTDAELAAVPPTDRFHVAPPWLRTRVLDPSTLAPVRDGVPGLLCHLDLANAGSVAAVLTEDLGVKVPGGLRVLGRVAGAEPRGCSLAAEELLRATSR